MNLQRKLLWGAGILLLTSCIDDKYDLANIDTTSEFKVNDLVLPVNIDPVLLSDIIKVKEGDQLKEVTIDGKTFYAVEQSGEFNSDGIDIDAFTAKSDALEDKTATFALLDFAASRAKKKADGDNGVEIYYLIEPVKEDIDYSADGIDGSVRSITEVNFDDLIFSVDLSTKSLSSSMQSSLLDVEIFMPTGLTVSKIMAGGTSYDTANYNPETGRLFLNTIDFTGNEVRIEITAVAVDLKGYPNVFVYDEKAGQGSFDLKSVFNIESGRMRLSGPVSELATITEISYNVHYELSDLNAKSIMGSIAYDLSGTGLDIEPIDLTDIPDFLDDPDTELILSDPRIYLQLMNPVGKYGLYYQSGLNIVANRPGQPDIEFTSPLLKVKPTTGTYNFMLAPDAQNIQEIPDTYKDNIERLDYPNLGYILYDEQGGGIPKTLDVRLEDPYPSIPLQTVNSPFELDQTIEGMEGKYMFLAPLNLKEGSRIVKTVDGWWSEDLADLTINILKVTAEVSNDLPFSVQLHVYPIDKEGNRIPTASDTSVLLPAGASNQDIELVMEGVITNLDGIQIYVMSASDGKDALAPSQVITLNNIKAKVTGNYTRKL